MACSHMFCDQHGSGEFSHSPAVCPACNSALSGKLDIVRTELSPSEEHKAMVLAGLRPETVLDISSRALSFWTYQVHQECLYQKYTYSKQLQSKDMELTSMKSEVSSLKKVLEEYKKKFSELSEKLMEYNRQYQKLQSLYDSLRPRNIAMANQEAAHEPPMMPQPAVFGFPLGNAARFPGDITPVRGRCGEGDFHFKPFFATSPPVGDSSKSFFTFASPSNELDPHSGASRAYKMKRM
uniref:Cyclin B1 interacting protein 1 n=1 Tax=Gopherus agassizii TaxID=38772 RepID=A0A452HWG5_9SAUR